MNPQIPNLTELSLNISDLLQPFITLTIIAVIGLMFKDFVNSFVKGCAFKLKGGFNVGDRCYIDKEEAIIIQIGLKESIFEIKNDRGKFWRYIPNEKISSLRLEKIIEGKQI